MAAVVQIPKSTCQMQLGLNLEKGTPGMAEEQSPFAVCETPLPLGDVTNDGN